MPISKRMNDLHIRSNHATIVNQGLENIQASNTATQGISHALLEPQQNGYCNDGNVIIESIYAPELSSTQNPYYYHINSILYEAHVLRQQRLSKVEIGDNNNTKNS